MISDYWFQSINTWPQAIVLAALILAVAWIIVTILRKF